MARWDNQRQKWVYETDDWALERFEIIEAQERRLRVNHRLQFAALVSSTLALGCACYLVRDSGADVVRYLGAGFSFVTLVCTASQVRP